MAGLNVDGWIRVSSEVAEAIDAGRPVVALESTVIAHGLPWPRNLETALELEQVVREGGAVPATIAILEGVPRIGLEAFEIEGLARSERVEKLSTRDLPVALARRRTGATTVAATAHLARLAGISVFATGGIGGVHRGLPPDVSADLLQLQRTPIIVVSAGAKSILDLPATREILEAVGILVLGYQTDAFPMFYSRGRELPVDARVESAEEVASIWRSHLSAALESAVLLCVPIPQAAEIPQERVEEVIQSALAGAEEAGIRGKRLTPYLLAHLGKATEGETTEANVVLIRNNASIAAAVAVQVVAT